MTLDRIAALATMGVRIGLLDQHARSYVQQVPDQRSLHLNGIFDVHHIGDVVAQQIIKETRRLWRLDADLVDAERKIATLRGEVLNGTTGASVVPFERLATIDTLEATLLTVPPVSLAGAAAKLRLARTFLENDVIAGILVRDALAVLDLELGA